MSDPVVAWDGWLHLDGWAGRQRDAVRVVGETPTRWSITPAGNDAVRLRGRNNWLLPGATALVPKHAVTQRCEDEAKRA